MGWVYLLTCADGAFYVGSTRDLEQRLEEHSTSKTGFTSRRRPVTLAWCAELDIADAYAIERRIHGWSRRKKQALIDGDIELLKALAKRGVRSDGGGSSVPEEHGSGANPASRRATSQSEGDASRPS